MRGSPLGFPIPEQVGASAPTSRPMRLRLWPLKRADDIFRALDRNEIFLYPGSVTHLRISRFVQGAPGAGHGRRCGFLRIA